MKTSIKYILFSIIVFLASCENQVDNSTNLIYTPSQLLTIRGNIEEGNLHSYCEFDKINMSFFSEYTRYLDNSEAIDSIKSPEKVKYFFNIPQKKYGTICQFNNQLFVFDSTSVIDNYNRNIGMYGLSFPDTIYYKKTQEQEVYYFATGVEGRNYFLISFLIKDQNVFKLKSLISFNWSPEQVGDFDNNNKIDVLTGQSDQQFTESIYTGYELNKIDFERKSSIDKREIIETIDCCTEQSTSLLPH